MKNKLYLLAIGLGMTAMVLGLTVIAAKSSATVEPMSRKIVVFKSGVLNEPAREVLMKKFGGVEIKNLPLIDGKTVLLPPKAVAALAKQAGVLRIDDDVVVFALAKPSNLGKTPTPQPDEVLPWGVARVNAEPVWSSGNTADLIRVGIIDTGISNTHPDLLANVKGGVNTINSRKNWNDDNGHGSHVAGIVGAIDNTIGVIGVGPAIDLYAIKVLDRNGSGWLSDVIEGIQWAIANNMQVVNMSLGTASDIQSFHDAVSAAKTAGIVVVAAAGNNNGGAVDYPGAYDEVIAVSAINSSDGIADFSSVGTQVDLAAPGVSIYSTYKGTGYATFSGTSMAAPHVAGSAALLLSASLANPGLCDTIKIDSKCDPDEVQVKLQATAIDLGTTGLDILYGYGLVNAYAATQ